jgi:TolB-like protein/Tfp pilus assembly protein PilF
VTSSAVFVSYASEDAAAALRICESLRAAGIEVWFDQSELRGGEVWDRQIRKQIHDCALFIAVISAHSNARNEGYFRREWRLAVERTHDMADDTAFLLPVVIDDTAEPAARVPEPFREVQWARLPAGESPARFVEQVQRLLAPEAPAASVLGAAGSSTGPAAGLGLGAQAAPGAPAARKSHGGGSRSRWGVVAALAVAIVVAAGVFTARRFAPSRGAGAAPQSAAGQGAEQQKSIAVLPFADMSEKQDQGYFADGVAEDVLDLLVKIPQLRVIGRTSSFQFKARNEDLRTIGEKLGAAYLVEGSVRKAGTRVRVSAQLIDAISGTQLWADTYDREFGDILDLQDQVAAGIARALQIAVVGEGVRLHRQLQSTEAYTHFLRGRAALDRGDDESVNTAVDELQQAMALDPGFTRAAETLALAYMTQFNNGGEPTKTGWPRAAAAARHVLQLDPKSALAHAIIGLQYATYDYDWPAARSELDQAVVLHTRDSVALYNIAWLAFDIGEYEEAVRLQNQSISIDPLNPDGVQNGGVIYYLLGNLDAAERAFRTSMHISPTFPGNHWFLCQVMLQRGDRQGAFREIQAETSSTRDFGLALVYHALGRGKDSDAALARAVRSAGNSAPVNVAILYAYRGERDQAFRWLEKAVDDRDMSLGHKFRNEPKLEPLRGDPRYKALLRKMNLPDQ